MANDYYAAMIHRLKQAIQDEDYQTAERIVNEELAMPYVPTTIYEQLVQYKNELAAKQMENRAETVLTDQQLADYLKKSGDAVGRAITFLDSSNVRSHLSVIQEYLKDPKHDRMVVALLFDIMHRQNVDGKMEYYDSDSLKQANPAKIDGIGEDQAVVQAREMIETIVSEHDPSFIEGCQQLLNQEVLLVYPQTFQDIKADQLAWGIVRKVCYLFGQPERWDKLAVKLPIAENDIYISRLDKC
jgi:hypothetical protein